MSYIFNLISDYYWFGYFSCFTVAFIYQVLYIKNNYYSTDTPIILSEHDDDFDLTSVVFSSLLWFVAIPVYMYLIVKMYMEK